MEVISSVFQSNTQAISNLFGFGAVCLSYTNTSILNSNFNRNSQRALALRKNRVTVDGCTFDDNSIQRDGGAVYGSNIVHVFNQAVFTNNRAGDSEGAVCLSNSTVAFYGSIFGCNRASRGRVIIIDNEDMLEVNRMYSTIM